MTSAIGSSTTPTTTHDRPTTPAASCQTTTGGGHAVDRRPRDRPRHERDHRARSSPSKRALENPIKAQAQLAQIALQAYGLIRTDLATLQHRRARAVARPRTGRRSPRRRRTTNVATVTAGSGTFGGNLTFTVDALASGGQRALRQHLHGHDDGRRGRHRRSSSRPAARRSASRRSRPTTRSRSARTRSR